MSVIHGKKTSLETIRSFATERNGLLLSTSYSNALQPMRWKCFEGHEFSMTFNHVKNRGQWCPICGREKALQNIRHRFTTDPSIRLKISTSHLNRLKKSNRFAGFSHREIAARLRDNLTGLLRNPQKHK